MHRENSLLPRYPGRQCPGPVKRHAREAEGIGIRFCHYPSRDEHPQSCGPGPAARSCKKRRDKRVDGPVQKSCRQPIMPRDRQAIPVICRKIEKLDGLALPLAKELNFRLPVAIRASKVGHEGLRGIHVAAKHRGLTERRHRIVEFGKR